MDAIIYTSQSGFTKKYADLLSKKTGLPSYNLKDVKTGITSVIYLGWLMAGGVKGYKKAAKLYDIRAICAVGMSSPGIQTPETIKKQNNISDIPVFYLQGGFDISKLHGIYKFMMKVMANTVGKKLAGKSDKTDEESDMLNMMTNGGDRVSEENLTDVLTWMEKQ